MTQFNEQRRMIEEEIRREVHTASMITESD